MHFWQATRRIFMLFRTPFCLLTTKKGHFWCSAPLEKCILRAFLSHFCPIFEHFCLIFAPLLPIFDAFLCHFSAFPDYFGAFLCSNSTLSTRVWRLGGGMRSLLWCYYQLLLPVSNDKSWGKHLRMTWKTTRQMATVTTTESKTNRIESEESWNKGKSRLAIFIKADDTNGCMQKMKKLLSASLSLSPQRQGLHSERLSVFRLFSSARFAAHANAAMMNENC